MEFDWPPAKSDWNLEQRGFGFDYVAQVFFGHIVTRIDDRRDYGEVRFNANRRDRRRHLQRHLHRVGTRPLDYLRAPRQQEGVPAMARISLDQLRANRPTANRAKIDATTEEDIRRHMTEDGKDPDAEPVGYRPVLSVTAIRERLGMTQIAFAKAIGVPVATVRNWEQGRKQPDPAARSLLAIVAAEPEAAFRALGVVR